MRPDEVGLTISPLVRTRASLLWARRLHSSHRMKFTSVVSPPAASGYAGILPPVGGKQITRGLDDAGLGNRTTGTGYTQRVDGSHFFSLDHTLSMVTVLVALLAALFLLGPRHRLSPRSARG